VLGTIFSCSNTSTHVGLSLDDDKQATPRHEAAIIHVLVLQSRQEMSGPILPAGAGSIACTTPSLHAIVYTSGQIILVGGFKPLEKY